MEESRIELAWAAGFFDGEGCTSPDPRKYTTLSAAQVDREVLDRLRAATGIGKVYGPYSRQPYGANQRPLYEWSAMAAEDVLAFRRLVYPMLSGVKRAQFDRVTSMDPRMRVQEGG